MEKEITFWKERWRKKQIGFHQPEINSALQKYWPLIEKQENPKVVLVPLCGKSRDMDFLLASSPKNRVCEKTVIGIELSEIAVQDYFLERRLSPQILTEKKLRRFRHGNLQILHGNFFHIQKVNTGNIDAFYDRACLIAFPPNLRRLYVRHLVQLLQPRASGLLLSLEYPQDLRRGPPFCVEEKEIFSIYSPHFKIEKLEEKSSAASPHLQRTGLNQVTEKIWLLRRTE